MPFSPYAPPCLQTYLGQLGQPFKHSDLTARSSLPEMETVGPRPVYVRPASLPDKTFEAPKHGALPALLSYSNLQIEHSQVLQTNIKAHRNDALPYKRTS